MLLGVVWGVWGFLGGVPGLLEGFWEACWEQGGSKIGFCNFLAPAGAAKGPDVGPKLGSCCSQVGTFWRHFGVEVDIFEVLK